MRKLAYLLIGIFVLTSTFVLAADFSQKEHIEFTLPEDERGLWKLDEEECFSEEDFLFEVWIPIDCKEDELEDEFISLASNWSYSSENCIISDLFEDFFGSPEEYADEVSVEVLYETEINMLIKMSSKNPHNPEEGYVRLIIAPESIHALTYLCEGEKCHSLNHEKWIEFLEDAQIVNSHL